MKLNYSVKQAQPCVNIVKHLNRKNMLIQTLEDREYASNVKGLRRNVTELTEQVKKQNELIARQTEVMEQLLVAMQNKNLHTIG
jgi:hypothetical protein